MPTAFVDRFMFGLAFGLGFAVSFGLLHLVADLISRSGHSL